MESPTRSRRRPGGRERARRWGARASPQGDQLTDVTERDEHAWFDPPWRDSRHAITLLETLGIRAGGNPLPRELHLALASAPEARTSADYVALDSLGWDCRTIPGVDGVVYPAAAATTANWLAQSHGGGHVANVYLRAVVGWLVWRGLNGDTVRWEVGRARAIDYGLPEYAAATFRQLWFRREYAAATRLTIGVR